MDKLPLELRQMHAPDQPLMEPCERLTPDTVAVLLAFMGTTQRAKVKVNVVRTKGAAIHRFRAWTTWLVPYDLEPYVLRRGDRFEVWVSHTAVAEVESANSPWWGTHRRRRTP